MHCKVGVIRQMIKEVREKVKIIEGKMWIPLKTRPDLLEVGTRVFYEPSDFTRNALSQEILSLQRQIEERERDSYELDDDKAWEEHLSMMENAMKDELEQLRDVLKCSDTFGSVESIHPTRTHVYLCFENGVDIGDSIKIEYLWVAIPDERVDWRPDEHLPEDDYAL